MYMRITMADRGVRAVSIRKTKRTIRIIRIIR